MWRGEGLRLPLFTSDIVTKGAWWVVFAITHSISLYTGDLDFTKMLSTIFLILFLISIQHDEEKKEIEEKHKLTIAFIL